MNSSVLQSCWSILGTIWSTFFTGWRIPLLNFTPATLIFGVLSFFVACKFIRGILTISTEGMTDRAATFEANRDKIRKKH